MKKFVPCSPGCASNCPVEKGEHDKGGEICCDSARQCCYYCFEDTCPVKEEYKIEKHDE